MIAALDDETTEPRQRWRLVFERDADAPEALAPGTAVLETFVASLAAVGVVVARSGSRPRLTLAAPLPVGVSGDRELADLFTTARQPIVLVRRAIEGALPTGHRLVDLHDAWLGEPALAAQVEAADYRVGIEPVDGGAGALAQSCRTLLGAETLPRTRVKGSRQVTYDLRPLLATESGTDLDDRRRAGVNRGNIREQGAGRPEEVIAALSEAAGVPLIAGHTRRTRLWLASELPPMALGLSAPVIRRESGGSPRSRPRRGNENMT